MAEENPHGKLTHFNLWSRQLSTDEMISFTQNCRGSLNKDGIFLFSFSGQFKIRNTESFQVSFLTGTM